MKKLAKRGFTLVEIMIVVAIIALLAAIAIPNLLRARHNANETAAIASVKTIATAMETWHGSRTPPSYLGASLRGLSTARPPYLDTTLGSGTKQGYRFTLATIDQNRFFCMGSPQIWRTTGSRWFLYSNYPMGGTLRGGCIYVWSMDQPGWRALE